MKPTLFAGVFATFAVSWFGIVMFPLAQLGGLRPQVDEEAGEFYPVDIGGVAERGRQVYAANGCVYCHSQQVRDDHAGADIARGWGMGGTSDAPRTRRTVARDYIYDRPVALGSSRIGPDLTNVGYRQTSAEWHYIHLYNPGAVTPGSNMPPFRFLFEKRKISGQRSADALALWGRDTPDEGYEVVPTPDARALVGYLLTLDRTYPLKEASQPAPEAPAAEPAAPKKEVAQ